MFNLSGLFEFFETIGRRGQWVGFLVGLTTGGGISGWLCWLLCKHFMHPEWKPKYTAIKKIHDVLVHEKRDLSGRLEHATNHLESLQTLNTNHLGKIAAVEKSLDQATVERDRFHGRVAVLDARLEESHAKIAADGLEREALEARFAIWLKASANKRWDQPVSAIIPAFRPLNARTMPIISVINLKGGVGKTTLTANLGATIAKREGLRVLMIDLDYQGSLSSRCLSALELQEARQGRRSVLDIFKNRDEDRASTIFRNVVRLEDLGAGPAYLLATDSDGLDEVESQVMAQWLMGVSEDDVRFRLREALHDPAVQREYDIVLLDCPPRLSTACVNALAASDYALIPVLPEHMSTETAPRLLRWLKKFQGTFCPDIAVLGVVANRVKLHLGRPILEHQVAWDSMKDQCNDAWGSHIRFFDEAMIRQFGKLPHRLAALSPEGKPTFESLVDLIWKELPAHAHRRSSAVHQGAHPAAPGVGSWSESHR
jgi:cellulose biosynthesis protein BcsQ